jgi:hypothetical protein
MSASAGNFAAAFGAVRRFRRVWLSQFVGVGVLLLAVYGWLWIPEARGWQVALSAGVAALILTLGVLLQSSTVLIYHWGRIGEDSSGERFLHFRFIKLLPAGVLSLVLLAAMAWVLRGVEDADYEIAGWIASWLSLRLRQPVAISTVYRIADHAWWLAAWLLIVLVWLPMAVAFTCRGLGAVGWRAALRGWLAIRYWPQSFLIVVVCGFLPWQLANWAPALDNLWLEAGSFLVRSSVAYALAITGWLLLIALTERITCGDLPQQVEEAIIESKT